MHAMTQGLVLLERGWTPPLSVFDLRRARLRLPPAWRPAMMTALHLIMGAGVGAALGAATGHGGFWLVVGLGLGAVLEAVARRA